MSQAPSVAKFSTGALVVPFVGSVRSVFSTMVGVETTVGAPSLKSDPAPTHDVSAIIGFSGEVVGSMVLTFQTETARRVVAAFANAPLEPGSPDFADAIGELANMVAGAAKKDLGLPASISVPTVIVGTGHTVARLSDVPCVVIPCSTASGEFSIEVNIKPAKAA